MARSMLLLTFLASVVLLLGSVEVRSEVVEQAKTRTKRAEACYEPLGCFANDGPFKSPGSPSTLLPMSPDIIRTTYLLYTRESRDTPQELDARYPALFQAGWINFKARPTKIIIHGFLDDIKLTNWWQEMIKELLIYGDYNVVFVDWSGGNLPPYVQSAANTRVVGAQLAELIKALMAGAGVNQSDFHIIGMSMGSHIAGYAGDRVPGIARITGLDPAGPNFEDTDTIVRLDENDATFVDVMHTDMKATRPLQITLGTKTRTGHVDFYANLGYDQPGCDKIDIGNILMTGIIGGAAEIVLCSHIRSIRLFTESINSPCPFMSFPCASEEDFVNNLCHSCANVGCARMGFHANENATSSGQSAKYYLTTGGSRPFCRYNFNVAIKLSANVGSKQRGTLDLVIVGDVFKRSQVSLTGKPETFQPGQSYKFYITLPHDFGNVESLTLLWKQASSGFIFGSSDIIGQLTRSLFVDEINIYREEAGVDARFCAGGRDVPSGGGGLTVSTKC